MNEVTVFRVPWGTIDWNNRENWYKHREPGFSFKTKLEGERAAEEAFHLTNAPDECLTDEQKQILVEQNFKGKAMSVGDVVRVENIVSRRMPQYFLCKSLGWEEYQGDRFELLKYLY